MATGPEKVLENAIKRELTRRHIWYNKNLAGPGVKKGVPDISAVYQGWALFFENKRPDGRGHITMVQKKNLMAITQNGGIGCVPMSLDFVKKVLDAIKADDRDALKEYGWRTHTMEDVFDNTWLEETVW